MIILDSSFYVALFKTDDSLHLDALAWMQDNSDTILLPQLILQETLTVITYKVGLARAGDFLQFIQDDIRFTIVETNLVQDVAFWKSLGKRISVIDASVIGLAISMKIPLVTFDKQMNILYNSLS